MTEHELVITGSSDGYVRIYSMESINPKQEIKTFQGQVLVVLRSSSLVHRSLCEEQLLLCLWNGWILVWIRPRTAQDYILSLSSLVVVSLIPCTHWMCILRQNQRWWRVCFTLTSPWRTDSSPALRRPRSCLLISLRRVQPFLVSPSLSRAARLLYIHSGSFYFF